MTLMLRWKNVTVSRWCVRGLAAVVALTIPLASCASREGRVADETTLIWEAGVVDGAVRAADRYGRLLSAALNRREAYASPAAAGAAIDDLAKAAEARAAALRKLQGMNAVTQAEAAQMTACIERYNAAERANGNNLHFPIASPRSAEGKARRPEEIRALGAQMSNLYVQIAKGMDEVDALKKKRFLCLQSAPGESGSQGQEVSFRFDS